MKTILMIEPFYGGSHKELIDNLKIFIENLEIATHVVTLPGKKWHWRARTSALYFYEAIPKSENYLALFCSSVLNLAELVALRPDLSKLHKIIYFHENQLVYPVQEIKSRDFQYGYNQILSALVADVVLFNSYHNMNSFLDKITSHLNIQPDFKQKNLKDKLVGKCKVVYYPVKIPETISHNTKGDVLHIVWPHRWEHDKNPNLFFKTLFELKNNNFSFQISVLGESFDEVPSIFNEAKLILNDNILNWGRLESKEDYLKCLLKGHIVLSTANHEFFGVAIIEGVSHGCFPLLPNNLVYPEIYPKICLYNTPNQLLKKLKTFCHRPYLAQQYLKEASLNFDKFQVEVVANKILESVPL